jgi:hypothetical protein
VTRRGGVLRTPKRNYLAGATYSVATGTPNSLDVFQMLHIPSVGCRR